MPDPYGQSWARLRSSVVFPVPDGPVMTSESPGIELHVQILQEQITVGRPHLDILELDPAVGAHPGIQSW